MATAHFSDSTSPVTYVAGNFIDGGTQSTPPSTCPDVVDPQGSGKIILRPTPAHPVLLGRMDPSKGGTGPMASRRSRRMPTARRRSR